MTLSEYAKTKLGIKENTNSFKQLIDDYNNNCRLPNTYKMSYNDAWCATFVSICLTHCGYGKNFNSVECNQLYSKLRNYTISKKYAKVNDIVFYSWNKNNNLQHVGIIINRNNNIINVIEGNKNNSVSIREISLYDSFIRHIVALPIQHTKDDITRIANEVINGNFGDGQTRINALKKNGYNPTEVQKRVNEILNTNIDTIAKDVIKGKYGNGEERKQKLKAKGYNPTEIQKRVDQLLKSKK